MSGGHFNYDQYRLLYMADDIEDIILNNDNEEKDQWGDGIGRGYSPDVVERLKKGVRILRQAFVYAHRIDWLLSGNDGEERFIRRLNEELQGQGRVQREGEQR
jgi:hypothetical protein